MSPRRVLALPTRAPERLEGWATVLSVEILYSGSELVGDHSSGVSVLQVQDVSELTDSGIVNVGGSIDRQDPTSPVLVGGTDLAYLSVDDLTDPDTTATEETILLAAATTEAYDDRTTVTLTPLREYKEALVVLDAAPDKTLTCLVDGRIEDSLEEGPRADGMGEIVWVEDHRGGQGLIATRMIGRRKKVDGGYLHPDLPITPGAMKQSYVQHPDEHAGSIPPAAFGGGSTNADVDWLGRLKSNAFETTAQGTIVRLAGGAGSLLIAPDGTVQHIGAIGDFDNLVSRRTVLADVTKGAPGGSFVLEDTGILDPPSQPPITDTNWLTAPAVMLQPQLLFGLGVKDDTHAFTMRRTSRGEPLVVKFNPLTGAVTLVFGLVGARLSGAPTMTSVVSAGYSSLSDNIQTLEYDAAAAQWLVRYYDWTTLAFDHEWVVAELGSLRDPQPAVLSYTFAGHEYTRICRSNPDGTIDINQYDNEVWAAVTPTLDAFGFGDIRAASALGSNVLLTGESNIVADAGTFGGKYVGQAVFPVININFFGAPGNTLGYGVAEYGDLKCAGMAWDDTDTNFKTWYVSAGSGLVARQSNFFEAGGYYTAVTYLDSATGHETVMSTPVLEEKLPGGNITYTIGEPPPGSDADSMRVYFARDLGAGVPARTSFWLQVTSAPGEWHADVFTVLTSGANPPATGTIPSGVPFEVWAQGTKQLAGDRTGEIYDLLAVGAGDIIGGSP